MKFKIKKVIIFTRFRQQAVWPSGLILYSDMKQIYFTYIIHIYQKTYIQIHIHIKKAFKHTHALFLSTKLKFTY